MIVRFKRSYFDINEVLLFHVASALQNMLGMAQQVQNAPHRGAPPQTEDDDEEEDEDDEVDDITDRQRQRYQQMMTKMKVCFLN